jgi:hypothetical protein
MVSTSNIAGRDLAAASLADDLAGEETTRSAVSWAAIFVGAVAAIAATSILLVLGTGLGLTMISPWYGMGASAATVGVWAVIWVVIVQWLSSGLGGYLTGRLRTKWVRLHTDEVFFRDTAHGFLAWSLATVVGVLIFASATASGLGGVARGTADITAAAASGPARSAAPSDQADAGYFVDLLLRTTNPIVEVSRVDTRAETTRILSRSLQDGQVVLSPDDRTYLAQAVATRTGVSQADAETRVDAIVTELNAAEQKARAAADEARKRAAQLSIVVALSMVIGAFIASAAAALGGRARDEA